MSQDGTTHAGRAVLRIVLPLGLLLAAVAIGAVLLLTPPEVPKSSPVQAAAVVGVADLTPRSEQVFVEAFGTVVAAGQVRIQPEVSGRVVKLHPELLPGGLIREGERLFEIDAADYEIAVAQAKADLEIAKLQVDQLRASVQALRSQAEQAEAELQYSRWNAERLVGLAERDNAAEAEAREANTTLAVQTAALAGLEAQIEQEVKRVDSAIAQTHVADSRLATAQLALSRTKVDAPFDALVLEESAERGQLVSPQVTVATLAATDEFWVEASVPIARLGDIRFAGTDGSAASRVTVTVATGDASIVQQGVALRSLGNLDPQGRMARVLVSIQNPLALPADEVATAKPILLGSYVRLAIEAGTIHDVYSIPRRALRENSRVWVRDGGGKLQIREVEIVWRRQEDVLVHDGFEPGDKLVVTHLASVIPGMSLDVRDGPIRAAGAPARARSGDGQ
ncbi:MAG TPA: HlyD family efflux transporter periplasmic adaptor subunit [Phycisphaerae bacterium]|nr:HlyD family efflux transporter periplasmic adaptor subunit [Phycisphaerae bacterium]